MAIRYTGGGADFMPLGYQDENITVEDLTNNTDVGNFLISAANALPNQSGIINALPNIMSPGVRTIENQAMRNFEQPYDMRDVAGESLPFNIDNLGNPTNDPRVVSEELGMTGFGRPTMADIAGMDLPQGMPSQYDQSAVDGYEDLIQNPLDNPNRLQNIERNIDIENEEFEEIPGFNFIDAPTSLGSRLQNLEYFNNPRTGFIDNNILARGNPNKGIMGSSVMDFFRNLPTPGNLLMNMAAFRNPLNPRASNYNPTLQGQIDYMKDQGMYGINPNTYLGQITGGRLAGKNLVSMFGSNDLGEMYSKDLSKLQGYLATMPQRFSRLRKNDPFSYNKKIENLQNKIKQNKIEAQAAQAAREAATAARAMARNPEVYRNAGITSGGFASQNYGTNENFSNRTGRGRTGYSEGGLASMFTRRG